MKLTTFADGTCTLRESETTEDVKQLEDQFPNPEAARFMRLLRPELMSRDPDITLELVVEPECDVATGKIKIRTILFSRDMTAFPPRLMQWAFPQDTVYDAGFAVKVAVQLTDYWRRARERRNAKAT